MFPDTQLFEVVPSCWHRHSGGTGRSGVGRSGPVRHPCAINSSPQSRAGRAGPPRSSLVLSTSRRERVWGGPGPAIVAVFTVTLGTGAVCDTAAFRPPRWQGAVGHRGSRPPPRQALLGVTVGLSDNGGRAFLRYGPNGAFICSA